MKLIRKILLKFLNRNAYIFLAGLVAFFKKTTFSYSQYGEDLIVYEFFKSKNINSNGVYIDIGAYHPKWISNTYLLSKKGWSGFVIDVDISKLNLFKIFRKNCSVICAAIAPGNSERIIKIYNFIKLFSEIDTLDKNIAEINKIRFNCDYETNEIKTLNINDLLKNCYAKYGICDFINIDIEGLDDIVIMDINFNLYKPKLILFEKNNINDISIDPIAIYLNSKNYCHLFSSNGSHGFYFNI
jgi:hypothetical protein